jgi:hypothetical protein
MAHWIACTMTCPAGRTSTVSVTGSLGRYICRRAHPGSSETAAAASAPYRARAITGSGGRSSRNRAASRASAVAVSSGR